MADANAKYLWHPMIDPKASAANPPLVIARGDGVRVFDIEGRAYLDCTAGLWCVNVGHNHPAVKRAITEQLDRIAYYATFGDISNPPSIELSAKLISMLAPEGMVKVMFSSGGSDANETAFKLARQYWKLEGRSDKVKILSLRNAYHGVHFGGMSASGNPLWRRAYEPMMPGFLQVEGPYLYRNPWTDDPSRLGEMCADFLEREIRHQSPETVAAFVMEPVQGAGGMIVPPANYMPLARAICDKYNILMIADETVTGFGRTGSLFGSRHWGVKPDIMCFAKGINSAYVPLGATAVNARVAAAWERKDPLATIMHGYTYSGHPLACAAAIANLKVVEEERLTQNAAAVGAYFLERLETLRRFPSVGDVRGLGLMLVIELVRDKKTKEAYAMGDPFGVALGKFCRERGALVRVMAGRIILSPALIFSRENVDEAVAAIEAGLAALDK
ncbi:MAG: aminotransferase class III-fold pyridoxal phosphate-dependent enzyme [Betaproteobacteria bacterium]|nr:aminotransferase class III-fold pyridoxal phosphate-dependent enzyme [Betaproteobacteria bacterium]